MYDLAQLKKDAEKIRKSGYFDEDWYKATYPDVGRIGIDPAEHYLRFGAPMRRDPGPNFCASFYLDTHPGATRQNLNPILHHLTRKGKNALPQPSFNYILWAAFNVGKRQGIEKAIELADLFLPENYSYTAAVLKANRAIVRNDEAGWLAQVNSYLAEFSLEPISLKEKGPSLLSRLTTQELSKKPDGPLVSVIMPAWNAEETVLYAAQSILNQTWENLELIIVDDASDDGTWNILKQLEDSDKRVKILRNSVNVGPYVSKNIALKNASGDYITGHDADDWAHPKRIENHIDVTLERNLDASLTYMIRMQPNGAFGHIGKVTSFSLDGVARKASISCIFKHSFLKEKLGFWDAVRFGADSEMIARTTSILGERFEVLPQISMICLDLETSLTNHPDHGVDKITGVSPIRANYRDDWMEWHKDKMTPQNAYLEFPQKDRRYQAAKEMIVGVSDIEENMKDI